MTRPFSINPNFLVTRCHSRLFHQAVSILSTPSFADQADTPLNVVITSSHQHLAANHDAAIDVPYNLTPGQSRVKIVAQQQAADSKEL